MCLGEKAKGVDNQSLDKEISTARRKPAVIHQFNGRMTSKAFQRSSGLSYSLQARSAGALGAEGVSCPWLPWISSPHIMVQCSLPTPAMAQFDSHMAPAATLHVTAVNVGNLHMVLILQKHRVHKL